MMIFVKKTISRAAGFVRDYLAAVRKDDLIPYAHQLTLSLILSVFPFGMFLLTLIGFLNLNSALILDSVERVLPETVHSFFKEIIIDVVDRQRGGLLSFSIILAVYAASGGFRAFMKGCNRVTGVVESRSFVKRYLLSVVWVILFALTLVLALLAIVFSRQIVALLDDVWSATWLTVLTGPLRLIVPILTMAAILTLLFMFGPAVRLRFRQAWPGALFTTLTWVLLTLVFRFYVDHFADYSRFYGALGALIALLIWLQLISTVLLLGVEVNAVLLTRSRAGKKDQACRPIS